MDQLSSCVAEVPYDFEIPPFFPFTMGYVILEFDGMACRAEDGRVAFGRAVKSSPPPYLTA